MDIRSNTYIRQVAAMKQLYPQFKHKIVDNSLVFIGNIHVKPELPIYTISIEYRGRLSPIVKVLNPQLVDNPKHVYSPDNRLCLYHPDLFKWNENKLIAKEIMDWTITWIYFYEVWLEHGHWFGPEAPH